jgi:hypothetical protein
MFYGSMGPLLNMHCAKKLIVPKIFKPIKATTAVHVL